MHTDPHEVGQTKEEIICSMMKHEKGNICLLHLQPDLQWSLCCIRKLSALQLHPTARLTMMEVSYFSLKLQATDAKLSYRGPRAESGFYLCCFFRNTSPNFFWKRKEELKKAVPLGSPLPQSILIDIFKELLGGRLCGLWGHFP